MIKKETFKEQVEVIKLAAKSAGSRSGIYKMFDKNNNVIYVGKAVNLSNRLKSYATLENKPNRLLMMISNISKIETIETKSETDALLLESNLIKHLKPFYNVLLKDDATFPYIVISDHEFPRIYKYRTTKSPGKNFYGPYPSVIALDETLNVIQKSLLIRNCTDSNFGNRNRPCLQYFVKRCSAPCVGRIDKDVYAESIKLAKNLLNGKDDAVKKRLQENMNQAAKELDFEKAALIRDRIQAITQIQKKQFVQIDISESIDVIAFAKGSHDSAVLVTFYRNGRNVGSHSCMMQNSFDDDTGAVIIESFLMQFYKTVPNPSIIVTEIAMSNKDIIIEALESYHGIKSKIASTNTVIFKNIMKQAQDLANIRLNREGRNIYQNQIERLESLIDSKINRIEVFDNSHIAGAFAYGCMIVFKDGKFDKNEYRKFSISEKISNKGDDLAMMEFTLNKRFQTDKIRESADLMIIDGGINQLNVAKNIIDQYQSESKVISIAKQNNRKKGFEKIILSSGKEILLDKDDELLYFLINLRDEAHRFAITTHRKKRLKSVVRSELDLIPSIGRVRKKNLLEHFGSVNLIAKAELAELMKVDGINKSIAEIVYNFFNKRQP